MASLLLAIWCHFDTIMKSSYIPCCATLLALCHLPVNAATVLSSWTFETNSPGTLSNSTVGPLVTAESGVFASISSMRGRHASADSDWTSPLGNGSTTAYSGNNWGIGDSFEFFTRTTGYSSITIAFDQIASASGPRNFNLLYSLNGSDFFQAPGSNYTLANASWNGTSRNSGSVYSIDLSSISAINHQPSVWLRLAQVDGIAVNGGSIAASGTSRIDNISITAAIPEPSTTMLCALAAPILLRRKRRGSSDKIAR